MFKTVFSDFGHSIFVLVSHFDILISEFKAYHIALNLGI